MGNVKTILSNTAIYGLGRILRSAASFVMLPIYTHYLTPSDYGFIELLTLVLDFAALIIGARISVGIFKYYSDARSETEKNAVVSTAMVMVAAANLIGVALLMGLAGAIGEWMANGTDYPAALRVMSLSLLIGAVNEIFFMYLRASDRAKVFVASNAAKLVVQICLNLLFVVHLEWSYWGVIWGTLLSDCLLLAGFSCIFLPRIGLKFNPDVAKRLFNFSIPLIVSSFGAYYLTFGDRYFIKTFQGLQEVGLYALAYKFGFLLSSLVWGPFTIYWTAKQYDYGKREDASRFFGQTFVYVNWIVMTAAAGIIALTPIFITDFADTAYQNAIPMVKWVVAAYVMFCWVEFFNFGFLKSAKTFHISIATYLSVAVISVLYILLIPQSGGVGAGQATLAAFAVQFLYTFLKSRKLFFIDVRWLQIGGMIGYFSAITFVLLQWPLGGYLGMLCKGSIILIASLLIAMTPVVDPRIRAAALQKMAATTR